MRVLDGIAPERVFNYFEDICLIPHGSGDTDRISGYCEEFARAHSLECYRDKLGNIIIRKPASAGYEDHSTVILQGHLDMVCEKESNKDIDFSTDGLELLTDGDFIFADRTTLGGDDGIAVAMILAILEDDSLAHPPIEALFTVDEETGMYGADAIDASQLHGSLLINIDSEEEGVLTVGCAGGARADINLPLAKENVKSPCSRIAVSGLIGGHSGVEIDKGRMNANVTMGRFLKALKGSWQLVSIKGGQKDNAIPRSCECVISTDSDLKSAAAEFCREMTLPTDPNLTVSVSDAPKSEFAFNEKGSRNVADFLTSVPNGVTAMDKHVSGLVETSLNLGILTDTQNGISASFSVRSSVNTEKECLLGKLSEIAKSFGGSMNTRGHYPAWEYNENSRLRNVMENVYREVYGEAPKVAVIHAGLECGLLSEKISNFDAVSIGPNILDIHTPAERLSISSVGRTYKYLLKTLERL